jgi:hypothetical protein
MHIFEVAGQLFVVAELPEVCVVLLIEQPGYVVGIAGLRESRGEAQCIGPRRIVSWVSVAAWHTLPSEKASTLC